MTFHLLPSLFPSNCFLGLSLVLATICFLGLSLLVSFAYLVQIANATEVTVKFANAKEVIAYAFFDYFHTKLRIPIVMVMIAKLTFPSVATSVMVIIIIDYDNDDCELK